MPKGRTGALLAAGVLLVHELRYLAGYGERADAAAAAHGHAYLELAAPLAAAAVAAAAGRFAAARSNARRTGRAETSRPRLVVLWGTLSAVLAAAYLVQESLEGLLAAGHPGGLAAVVGHGGWSALVLVLAIGAVIALLLRGASAAIVRAARRGRSRPRPRPRRRVRPPAAVLGVAPSAPLARHLAGRAPPPASFV